MGNVTTCKDTDERFDIFATKYDQIFNNCFSLTRLSIKRCNDKQWMNKDIRNSIIMKTTRCKKYINRPNDNNKTLYRQYKISSQLLYGRRRNYIIVIYFYMQNILPESYGKFTQNFLIRVNGILPRLKSWLSMTLT